MRPLVLTLVLLLLAVTGVRIASAESEEQVRTLHPGDNLVGWVGEPTTPAELFGQIPQAELVYTWDAKEQRYLFAVPAGVGDLSMIKPGMGIVIRIGGQERVNWDQVSIADGELLRLSRGFNFVAWTGPSGTPIDLAVRPVGPKLQRAFFEQGHKGEHRLYSLRSAGDTASVPLLNRGDAMWVLVSEDSLWLQSSGERALYPLEAPPAVLEFDPFYEKHLDADGISVVASQHVSDEALFRFAAILDDMLADRPGLRDLLATNGVHVAILGEDERLERLPVFRNSPQTFMGRRILGPGRHTPMVVPEENILCRIDDVRYDYDVTVYGLANAILYAIGKTPAGSDFHKALRAAYDQEARAGRWPHTWASVDAWNFWNEGLLSWFGLNDSPGGIQNDVDTRAELEEHAPLLARLIRETVGDVDVTASCREVVTEENDIDAAPFHLKIDLPDDGEAIGYEITYYSGGQVRTWTTFVYRDGSHHSYLPYGTYKVRIAIRYPGCGFRGWLGNSDFEREEELARLIVVDEPTATVLDVTRLPDEVCQQGIVGRLTDVDGSAAQGIRVYAYASEPKPHSGWATTDAEGKFVLPVPFPGSYRVRADFGTCLVFYSTGGPVWSVGDADYVGVSHGMYTVLEDLSRQGLCEQEVSGRVVDADSNPIGNVAVAVWSRDGRRSVAHTDPDGEFVMMVNASESYRLAALRGDCFAYWSTTGLVTEVARATWVDVGFNDEVADVELQIPSGMCDRWIRGHLLYGDDKGAAGKLLVALNVDSDSNVLTVTQQGGRWSLAVPNPGHYRLYVIVDDCIMYYSHEGIGVGDKTRARAVDLTVDSVEGLVFRLPQDPSDACS